ISPANDSGDSDGNVVFNYNVTDTNNVNNCSLIFGGVVNQTNTSITKSVVQNFTLNNLVVGAYNWSVNCTDSSNNINGTSLREFAVITATNFSGQTTNLENVNVSNITNLLIEDANYGLINFSVSVDLSNGTNIDEYVNISNNRIEINSSALPALNVSARLTLYNLSFTDPRILRDGSVCPSTICTEISYTGGNLIFNVTQFSVYSAEETPVTTPTTTTTTGGGGGGGSAAVIPPYEGLGFSVTPENFEKTIELRRIDFGSITIDNLEDEEKNFDVSVEVLDEIIVFDESSFVIDSKGTKKIEFEIHSPREPGVYTGKIIVSSGNLKKEVLVIINVRTEKGLFDIILTLPKNMKILNVGKNLNVQIDLIQMGLKNKMDVTLNYVIKDFSGNTYWAESETIAVEEQKKLDKEIFTDELKSGDYVLGVELIYPDGVAVASSQFKIKDKLELDINEILMLSLALLLIMVAIVIYMTIKRYKKATRHLKKK
ncbi:MAG: hypothetical protein AABX88_02625, partial [Nanoarchaeota archaeon]